MLPTRGNTKKIELCFPHMEILKKNSDEFIHQLFNSHMCVHLR
jgi:hypothetical protein